MTRTSNSPLKHKKGNYKAHKGTDGILYGERLYHEKFGGKKEDEIVVEEKPIVKKPKKKLITKSENKELQKLIDSGKYSTEELEKIRKRLENQKTEAKAEISLVEAKSKPA